MDWKLEPEPQAPRPEGRGPRESPIESEPGKRALPLPLIAFEWFGDARPSLLVGGQGSSISAQVGSSGRSKRAK